MTLPFESERLVFRPFTEGDLPALEALHFDAEVMRFLAAGVRTSADQVRRDLTGYLEHQARHGFGKWAVVCRASGRFAGRAGLVLIDATDELDLGYTFHRAFWGRGLGTEAAAAIRDWAARNLPSAKLVGLVHADHHQSARVLGKIGFQHAGSGHYFGGKYEIYRPA